jgi:NADPH-dependent curcumin reductase CurA
VACASLRRSDSPPAGWVREGKLRYREDIDAGIEHCPGAIAELYRRENLGKRLIRLRAE